MSVGSICCNNQSSSGVHPHSLLSLLHRLSLTLLHPSLTQAALLTKRATLTLSKYLHHLTAALPHTDGPHADRALLMTLELLAILCNPEHCLNPGLPRATRLWEDMPTPGESVKLATTLMMLLPQLPCPHVDVATSLLLGPRWFAFAQHDMGRLCLAQGAVKWQALTTRAEQQRQQSGGVTGLDTSPRGALLWAAGRLSGSAAVLEGQVQQLQERLQQVQQEQQEAVAGEAEEQIMQLQQVGEGYR
jgi:hypothetical protein